MIRFITILLSLCLVSATRGNTIKTEGETVIRGPLDSVASKAKKYVVEISVTSTARFCGGIKPSPEMIRVIQTPRALVQKKLYIKRGDKNTFKSEVILETCTDTLGKLKLLLPPGRYLIVDELKKDRIYYNSLIKRHLQATKEYSPIDRICLRNWFEQPDFVFEVTNSDSSLLTLNFQMPCSWDEIPCIQYYGPKPP